MLRRIIKLETLLGCGLTAMTVFTGCVSERYDYDMRQPEDGSGLVLEISGLRTRASASDFTEAEKLVRSVDLFFYPEGADDATEAIYYVRTGVTMNTENQITSNYGKIRVNIKPEELFTGTETSCRVYAAVNTGETDGAGLITLGALKNLKTVCSDWIVKDCLDENGDLSEFGGFVMFTINPEGDQVLLVNENGNDKIKGTIIVDKLISKIDLLLGFGASGTETNIDTWRIVAANPNEPGSAARSWKVYQPSAADRREGDESVFGDAAEVYIVNGVRAARLGGCFGADGTLLTDLSEDDYFDLWDEDEENDDNDFMNYAHGFKYNGSSSSKATHPYWVEAPFYTYPNSWSDGVLNTTTYLILKVNWIPEDGDGANAEDELLETYYKVPLNKDEGPNQNKILSNRHYSVKVKINTLGGLHFGEPLLLDDCSYEIIPWDRLELDAKLRETRYLEVRQDVVDRDGTHYTGIMNNSEVITIPFYSSHKVEIREATVTYYDFQYTVKGEGEDEVKPTSRITNIDNPTAIGAFTLTEDLLDTDTPGIFIDEINSRIVIQHKFHPIQLSGDRYVHVTSNQGSGRDRVLAEPYSPYDFHIVLKHKDSPQTFELDEIDVRQYPARYVEITQNPGGPGERPWLDFTGATTRQYGYVIINGARNNFGGADGIRTGWFSSWTGDIMGYTENPMMYIVNVTNLNEADAPLHIGDPRTIYIDNNLTTAQEQSGGHGNIIESIEHYTYADLLPRTDDDTTPASWSTNALGWENHANVSPERRLTYYYPTNETPLEEYRYMVSPRFRVGSSYGNAGQSINRNDARKRCASYQEHRYPAGRWRLPTVGELTFMARLSQQNVIPPLFSDGQDYWSSHGLYTVTGADVSLQIQARISGNEGKGLTIKGYVRCVYDEWYWQDRNGEPDIISFDLANSTSGDFRWGDKKKNNPQTQPELETE